MSAWDHLGCGADEKNPCGRCLRGPGWQSQPTLLNTRPLTGTRALPSRGKELTSIPGSVQEGRETTGPPYEFRAGGTWRHLTGLMPDPYLRAYVPLRETEVNYMKRAVGVNQKAFRGLLAVGLLGGL